MLSKEELARAQSFSETFFRRLDGIKFFLLMRDEKGLLSYHTRINQPCYGELRKYKTSHQEDCTKPDDKRPGDLANPFPKGIPEALGVCFSSSGRENILDFLWSDKSPWVRGFGGEGNVVRFNNGVLLKDTSIDPTVLVNLLININGIYQNTENYFNRFIELGLSPTESMFLCIFSGFPQSMYIYGDALKDGGKIQVPSVNTYVNPMKVSLKRIFEQDPLDLTGGTLRDRFDYERKNLHKIFHDDGGV